MAAQKERRFLILSFFFFSCGSGLSGEEISDQGHMWVGMDISRDMLSEWQLDVPLYPVVIYNLFFFLYLYLFLCLCTLLSVSARNVSMQIIEWSMLPNFFFFLVWFSVN